MTRQLDHTSLIPLYYQLKEFILEKIESDEWHEGHLIPSEEDFQRMFSISRITVRRAIELLANEGFLEKQKGKGTFVRKRKIEEQLPRLTSFTEEMRGREAKKEVIFVGYTKPTPGIAKILGLSPDEEAFHLKRLMVVEGSPLGVLYSYIPGRYGLSLEEDYSRSLYDILETNGIRLSEADQIIEASMSTREEILLLGSKAPFPTLVINRTAYSVQGVPVEFTKGVYHAARYRYSVKLTRY
ncbi:MAG: GntR family transcriptional regulator [Deltaproteobacteria bacterium]|nr:GntR family transcriptional regulator [Deltaproteobacteria bacterium]